MRPRVAVEAQGIVIEQDAERADVHLDGLERIVVAPGDAAWLAQALLLALAQHRAVALW